MYFLLKMGICHCYVSLQEGTNLNFHLIDQSHHTGDPLSCARVVLANEDVLQQSSKAQLEMWQVTTLPLRLHNWFPTKRQGTLMWWSKILPRTTVIIYCIYIYTLTLLKVFFDGCKEHLWNWRTALHPECWKRIHRSFRMWKSGFMSCLLNMCYPLLSNQRRVEST